MKSRGYLIYNRNDYDKNKWFANELVREGEGLGLSLSIIFAEDIVLGYDGNDFEVLYLGTKLEKVGFVINRTRDSLIGKHFELLGCMVCNSSFITEVFNNKAKTHQHINELGIKSVKTVIFDKHRTNSFNMEYPLIIKSLSGHGGQEVYKADNEIQFKDYINNIKEETVLIQEMCSTPGIDIRVFVIGNEVCAAVKRYSSKSFKSNFSLGGSSKPYELTEEEYNIVSKILEKFKLDFAGIDFIIGDNNELLFNEIEDVVGCRTLYQNYDVNVAKQYMIYIKKMIDRS